MARYASDIHLHSSRQQHAWQLYRKNPSLLTYDVSSHERHNCERGQSPAVSVCSFALFGDYMNIGHTGQTLYRCWSWLRLRPVEGRYLLELRRPGLGWPGYNEGAWQTALMSAMNAKYTREMPRVCAAVWKWRESAVPVEPFLWPGFTEAFFASAESGWELAAAVMQSGANEPEKVSSSKAIQVGSQTGRVPVRVGVLNRRGQRRPWIHAAEFLAKARQSHPEFLFDEWTMDNLTLAEQAHSIRSHDIIITPHGAQNGNFAFARPCTVMLELFPAQYFLPMYLDLASEVGVRSFWMYPGSKEDAVREAFHTAPLFGRQKQLRFQKVTTPAAAVLATLGTLLQELKECRRQGPLVEIPEAFDGVPTLGGFQWLSRINASRANWARPFANFSRPLARGPACHFCNASAGCCQSGVRSRVDRRKQYYCRTCYG